MFYRHVKDPTTADAEQLVRTRVHLEPGHRAINLKSTFSAVLRPFPHRLVMCSRPTECKLAFAVQQRCNRSILKILMVKTAV